MNLRNTYEGTYVIIRHGNLEELIVAHTLMRGETVTALFTSSEIYNWEHVRFTLNEPVIPSGNLVMNRIPDLLKHM